MMLTEKQKNELVGTAALLGLTSLARDVEYRWNLSRITEHRPWFVEREYKRLCGDNDTEE